MSFSGAPATSGSVSVTAGTV
ncbi:hypothetical protein [Antribacter gilvus]